MSKQTGIYAFIVAVITPFLIWALVASMARRHPRLLEQIYPVVKNLAWVLYVGAVVLVLFGMGDSIDRKIGSIGVTFSGGFNLMYGWMRRRVELEPKASTGGWWPTPKDY